MLKPIAATALAALALSFAGGAPAHAQDEASERLNLVIVYGDDVCPASTDEEITVCARKSEGERYRIPESLRFSDTPENTAWAERVDRLEMVGSFGAMSCSPTGLAGFTGCTQQMIDAAYKDKNSPGAVRFAELIEQARAERMEGVDAAAAEEQARVEMIEREYMERLERERAAEAPADTSAPPSPQN